MVAFVCCMYVGKKLEGLMGTNCQPLNFGSVGRLVSAQARGSAETIVLKEACQDPMNWHRFHARQAATPPPYLC